MEIKLNVFAPTKAHSGQLEVINDPSRFKLVRCGRKWRKTSLFTSWQMENAILCTQGLTYPLILPFQEQARESVWNDHVKRFFNELIAKNIPFKPNETSLSVTFPHNQARFKLFGINNEIALRSNSNWGALACDEFDDFPRTAWTDTLRPNLMTHKARAMVGGTPKGYKNIYKLEFGKDTKFKAFHYTSMDNPDLDPGELEELKAEYQARGMGAYRQEILAEYEKPHGTVYEEWDLQRSYIPFDYDPNLPVHLSWDFGVNDPTAILFIQPNGSEIRIFDYYEASDANIEHFVQYISSLPYKIPAFESGDIAGKARELVSGKSPINELARLKHFVRTSSIPNIPVQVRNTHKFIPRIYLSSSNPRCERIRDCFLNYRYPEIKETLVNQENETPIHDEYSHAMKALEYYCWNIIDPTQQLKVQSPANSFHSFLRQKEEEKWRQDEYGY